MRKVLAVIFSVVLASYFVSQSVEKNVKEMSLNRYQTAIESGAPATVSIFVEVSRPNPENPKEKVRGKFLGSGVFVTPNGHVLSCAHLFNHGFTITSVVVETANGITVPAEILTVSGKSDLSLLKVNLDVTPFIRLIDPRMLRVGDEVIAIGAPRGFDKTVTHGMISALTRDLEEGYYNLVQSDTAINPGNSGGPLINLKGELVGINVLMVSGSPFYASFTGLGFAVSPAQILEFLVRYRGLEITYGRG